MRSDVFASCASTGLGAACDYLSHIGMENIHAYEHELGVYLYEKMTAMDRVKVYGPPVHRGRGCLCAFNVEGVHSTDLAMVLDQYGRMRYLFDTVFGYLSLQESQFDRVITVPSLCIVTSKYPRPPERACTSTTPKQKWMSSVMP